MGGHPSWVDLNRRLRGRLRLGLSVMFVPFPVLILSFFNFSFFFYHVCINNYCFLFSLGA